MAGRRLIDAAKLFNASRSVAKQHINLRSQQLDVYSKTSTLAKTVKNQTDRVTLTAKAAVALAERFNGPPLYTGSAGKEQTSRSQDEPIPSKKTVNSEDTHGRVKVGLEQDHHYDRSEQNAQTEPSPDREPGIKQEKSRRQPLPDGVIPPPGTILESTKIPKNTEDKQGSDEHVENGQIHPDVFYSTPEAGQGSRQKEQMPHQAAIPGQEQVPKGINTDVFRTARVARMLGGNPYKDKTRLDLKGASRTPIDHTELAARKNQDTFNVRQTAATTPAKPEQIVWEGHQETPSAENEIRDFVSDPAKDVEAISEPLSEVGYSLPDPIASKAC